MTRSQRGTDATRDRDARHGSSDLGVLGVIDGTELAGIVTAVAWTALLWRLVGTDGGRWSIDLPVTLLLAAVVAGAAIAGLRQAPRLLAWLATSTLAGVLIAAVNAGILAGWVRATATLVIGVAAGLGAVVVWSRRWGPAVAGTVLVILGVRAWYLGALSWWGGARGRTRFLALSFENQSGPLLAAVGLVGVGMAVAQQGWRRGVGVGVTAVGLAGAWLSGSRATVVLLVPVLVLVAAVAWRQDGARRTVVGIGSSLAAMVVAVAAFTLPWAAAVDAGHDAAAVQTPGLSDRLGSMVVNPSTSTASLNARFGYWRAAVEVWRADPLTGAGPGSFRWAAAPYWPDDVELTATPHNEYLGALADRGLIGGLPLLVTAVAIGWLALVPLRPRWRPPQGLPAGRRAARLGAIGAAALLGSHAGVDFDFDYPLLTAALAIAGAVLVVELTPDRHGTLISHKTTGPREAGTVLAVTTAAVVTAAAVVTVFGARMEIDAGPAVWNLAAARSSTIAAIIDDDLDAAREHLDALDRFNPAAWSLPALEAVLAHAEGELTDVELRAAVSPRGTAMADQTVAAERLLAAGAAPLALDVLDELRPVVAVRPLWGVETRAAEITLLSLEATAQQASSAAACDAVLQRWRTVEQDWLAATGAPPELVADAWAQRTTTSCELTGS